MKFFVPPNIWRHELTSRRPECLAQYSANSVRRIRSEWFRWWTMPTVPTAIQVSRWHSVWPTVRRTRALPGTVLEMSSRIHCSERGRLPHVQSASNTQYQQSRLKQIKKSNTKFAWLTFGRSPHSQSELIYCSLSANLPQEQRHSGKSRRSYRYTTKVLSCCANRSNNMQIADTTWTTNWEGKRRSRKNTRRSNISNEILWCDQQQLTRILVRNCRPTNKFWPRLIALSAFCPMVIWLRLFETFYWLLPCCFSCCTNCFWKLIVAETICGESINNLCNAEWRWRKCALANCAKRMTEILFKLHLTTVSHCNRIHDSNWLERTAEQIKYATVRI